MQFWGTAVLKYCSTAVLLRKKLIAHSTRLISTKTLRYSVKFKNLIFSKDAPFTNFFFLLLFSTEYLNALEALLKL